MLSRWRQHLFCRAENAHAPSVPRVAKEYDRFTIVHTGCFHVRTYPSRAPLKLDELRPYFGRFPDVRVCLGHMNRGNPEAVWELQREDDQVYTDTSCSRRASYDARSTRWDRTG
jgi:Amidohydrolase